MIDLSQVDLLMYPTDTIYGVGCNAEDEFLVEQIREMKQRPEKPVSVIVPSMEWIYENCHVSRQAKHFVKKLPGPYTFVLPLKNPGAVADSVTKGTGKVGVRMPNHWISQDVQKYGKPFVTTSVNVSGQPHCTNPGELDEELKRYIDVAIDVGYLDNGASIVYDCSVVPPQRLR